MRPRCSTPSLTATRRTAHIDDKGEPFWDTSFAGKADMGCPFALDGRRAEIRGRVERFAEAYREAGLTPGLRLGGLGGRWPDRVE